MTRLLLVGDGPLPAPHDTDTDFAQLRLHQLFTALRADHDVHVVDARRDDIGAALRELRPGAVVTAGTYAPTRAALAHVGDEPLCVDLPGDPFADAQMVAAFGGADAIAAEARAVFVPALARADAFTTISPASRHALIGQLGVLGRTARTPLAYEWAHVTPIAWEFPGLAEAPPRAPGAPVRVALVGGFNAWFDDETLLAGLLRAMDHGAVEVDVVGGPIPGHHTLGFARFAAGARASTHADRFRFHGRLPAADLARVLARCTVGVVLDRPGYEPELGSRTRMLLWLHQGLSVVATARCPLARELADGGWLREVPPEDPAALADALLRPFPPLPDRAPLRARYAVAATTAGLRAWAGRPARAPAAADADPLLALARERDALRAELAALRGSPTWRALDRLRRLTVRAPG
ncbi:MAG: glycosyltransferase [Myxococcota bacterium]